MLGSGGLTIGQAGEFDYSGSQAIKARSVEKDVFEKGFGGHCLVLGVLCDGIRLNVVGCGMM